jgi:hypothetical protein
MALNSLSLLALTLLKQIFCLFCKTVKLMVSLQQLTENVWYSCIKQARSACLGDLQTNGS